MPLARDDPRRMRVDYAAAAALDISVDDYRMHRDFGEKWCTWCKTWHEIGAFGIDRSATDGRQTRCRDGVQAMNARQRRRHGLKRARVELPDPDAVDHDCAAWAIHAGSVRRCLFAGCGATWNLNV